MNHGWKNYIVFGLSQALSQLGRSMTGLTLILWAYEQNGSAMTVSLMSFFHYIPYILASIFAGSFVDSHSKKKIMLASDSIAALCSAAVFSLSMSGGLLIWNIYLVNLITGFMNAFQGPASAVAIGRIVPKDRIKQVSGMNAFSSSLVTVLAPILAASLYAFGGLPLVIIDVYKRQRLYLSEMWATGWRCQRREIMAEILSVAAFLLPCDISWDRCFAD